MIKYLKNKQYIKLIISVLVSFYALTPSYSIASSFSPTSSYKTCFTPGENCTQIIVDMLNNAKQSIFIQAYSFTSASIASSVVAAKHRGLDVKVILDKSQVKNNRYSSAKYLVNSGIPTWIDYRPAIAHNKVIIIDGNTVITGSFNFTKSAQTKNAENLIIISDSDLAKKYFNNWSKRKDKSMPATEYSYKKVLFNNVT